jgi:predicted nucleic acid-binding protein
MRTLVDTSAWIDLLRHGAARQPDVANVLKNGNATLCPAVWAELWSGVRGKREEDVLEKIRQSCGWLEIDSTVWELTADLGRVAMGAGLNCPLADILIVACARRHGAELLHLDKHIDALLALDFPGTNT